MQEFIVNVCVCMCVTKFIYIPYKRLSLHVSMPLFIA